MKHLVIAIVVLSGFAASAQSGVDAIAKQRAKDVANQNNNRNPETPPTYQTPAATAKPARWPERRVFILVHPVMEREWRWSGI